MGAYTGGGFYEGGAYKIILDIKKTLLKDLDYFRRNFFMEHRSMQSLKPGFHWAIIAIKETTSTDFSLLS